MAICCQLEYTARCIRAASGTTPYTSPSGPDSRIQQVNSAGLVAQSYGSSATSTKFSIHAEVCLKRLSFNHDCHESRQEKPVI